MLMIDWKGTLFPTSEWLMDRYFSKTFFGGGPYGLYQPKLLRETRPYWLLLFLIRMLLVGSLLLIAAVFVLKLNTALMPVWEWCLLSKDEESWEVVDSVRVGAEIIFQNDEYFSNATDGTLDLGSYTMVFSKIYGDTIIAYNSGLVLGTENYGTGLGDKE